MKLSITLLTILLSASAWGQAADSPYVVSFTGKYVYTVTPIAYVIQVRFEENSNKCDPVKGVMTLEEQLLIFTDAVNKFGITANDMDPDINGSYKGPYTRSKRIKIMVPTRALSDSLKVLCSQHGFNIEQYFSLIDPNDLTDDDEKAVAALGDANQQASLLAKHLGKKVVRVISMDNCPDRPMGKGSAARQGNYYYHDSDYYDGNYYDDEDEDYLFDENDWSLRYNQLYKDKILLSDSGDPEYYNRRPCKGIYRMKVTYLLE